MKASTINPRTSTRLPIARDTAVLCAAILVAPELFGGAFPWTVVVIAGLFVACLGTAIWVRRAESTPVVDGVFIVMSAAWLWTCLQVVPLPSGVAHALRLGAVQSAERLQGLAWADSISITVSYDPGSTYIEILVGISILSAFLAARLVGPRGLKPIAAATARDLPLRDAHQMLRRTVGGGEQGLTGRVAHRARGRDEAIHARWQHQ